MEFISDSIVSCQLAAFVASIPSLCVVGSPVSMRNKPGKYLSGGWDSLSYRCGMTGLAGSSAILLHTFELGSSDPIGVIVDLLLECSASMAPSVLRGLADRKADLVCYAGPSKRSG
jgi:hypothetical protein